MVSNVKDGLAEEHEGVLSMKGDMSRVILLSMLAFGCGQEAKQLQIAKQNATGQTDTSSQQQTQNEMYLQDMVESAADSATSAAATPSAGQASAPAAGAADSDTDAAKTVESDVKPDRLQQMVSMLMEKLDTDKSGSISLEEFLAVPKEQGEKAGISAEIKDKITAKLTADFNKFAGDDKLLSSAELQDLLKAAAPRIGRHRCGQGDGMEEGKGPEGDSEGHGKHPKLTAKEFIAKYDTDGDGKLSETEIAAFKKDREANEGNDKPRHPGFGPMRMGPH